MTRQPTRYRDCVNTFESPSRIPPTEVGGWFRSNLHASTHRVLESHQRKLVDCSDPASETKRPSTFKSVFSFTTLLCRRTLDLNNPPTSVGGISELPHNLYREMVPHGPRLECLRVKATCCTARRKGHPGLSR